MVKSLLFTLILLSLYVSSCKVVKYTPEKFPTRQIIWGNGGGFAGIEVAFVLLPNGQLFKKEGVKGNYQELKPLKQKQATPYFEKVASLQLYKQDINKPGNIYYFIQEKTEITDSRVTWGAGDYIPPEGFVSIYKELSALGTRPPLKSKNDSSGIGKAEKVDRASDPNKW